MHNRKHRLNIKKGYKLVGITRTGKLRSYALSSIDEGCIEYEQNCWVSQPLHCGPLAVFNALDDALQFAKDQKLRSLGIHRVFALWSCDYIPSPERTLWMTYKPLFSGTRKVQYNNFPLAYGTRFAQRVRLLNNITVFQSRA